MPDSYNYCRVVQLKCKLWKIFLTTERNLQRIYFAYFFSWLSTFKLSHKWHKFKQFRNKISRIILLSQNYKIFLSTLHEELNYFKISILEINIHFRVCDNAHICERRAFGNLRDIDYFVYIMTKMNCSQVPIYFRKCNNEIALIKIRVNIKI